MRAAVLKKPGELELCRLEKPVPGKGEAVIRVVYAGICGSDITVYKGEHPTATYPVVQGHEILGVIDEINDESQTFKKGDRVVVNPLISCGVCQACISGYQHVCQTLKLLGIHENGGFAEYVKVSVDKMVKVPQELSDKVAALCEPFAVGYHVAKRSGISFGDSVLVIGGGTIGIVAALVARQAGARVIVSELNSKRLELVKCYNFETINPAEKDPMASINELTNGLGFDVVIEASGSRAGILLMPKACRIRGTMVSLSLSGKPVEFELGKVSFKELSVIGSRVYEHIHFLRAAELLRELSKCYELEKIVSQEYSIDEVQQGICDMMNGVNVGKILIRY